MEIQKEDALALAGFVADECDPRRALTHVHTTGDARRRVHIATDGKAMLIIEKRSAADEGIAPMISGVTLGKAAKAAGARDPIVRVTGDGEVMAKGRSFGVADRSGGRKFPANALEIMESQVNRVKRKPGKYAEMRLSVSVLLKLAKAMDAYRDDGDSQNFPFVEFVTPIDCDNALPKGQPVVFKVHSDTIGTVIATGCVMPLWMTVKREGTPE